jgi:uncharacterized protein (TIGR00251 family)
VPATWYRLDGDVLTVVLHVQPGAKRTEVLGTHGDALKLRLAAPAIDGRANACLIDFLAQCFAVPKSAVEIRTGAGTRRKLVAIAGSRLAAPDALAHG